MADQIFTLEFLEAGHGDALLLHYGPAAAPRLIVIDGGPKKVFEERLKPRLEEIRTNRNKNPLEIRMVMVSHIDDDHIKGICKMFAELRRLEKEGEQLPYDILTLWHNSFDDLIAKMGVAGAASLSQSGLMGRQPEAAAIVASVGQGRTLRLDADALAVNMNSGFDDLIRFDPQAQPLKMGAGLRFTVLGPRQAELNRLRAEWKSKLKEILEKEAAEQAAQAAEFIDKSIANLSSIVVLAEFDKKTMLLTGDARGDFILESLRESPLLTNGRLEVDILKVPHHGSSRNSAVTFFDTVRAPHYVISADAHGSSPNPSPVTLKELFDARPEGGYTVWMTNDPPGEVNDLKRPPNVTMKVRPEGERSDRINLFDPITW